MNAATKPEAVPSTDVPTNTIAKAPCRVLKIATCPSLSGKSQLTYHVGCVVDGAGESDAEGADAIQFRVVDNTNIGFFSQEWVPLKIIQDEFAKVPAGQTITSFLLHGLFRGKSVNTPAFLFAVLKSEGLVQPAKDSTRRYDRMDPAGFMAKVQALIATGVDLKVDESTVKNGAKPAMVKTKTAKVDASTSKISAVAAKPTAKPASGVDIAEIVEAINAKVGAQAKPAMPAKKTTAKTAAKPAPMADATAKQ